MAAVPHTRLTEQQYLEIERAAEFRCEYYGGEMYAMSGETYPHGKLSATMTHELMLALKARDCTLTTSDVRLRISQAGSYTYPDVMVVCGEPKFADDQADTVVNPTLIVEVLSKSTEAHDRGLKFAQYRKLESLREYVLVSQHEPRVEVFRRQSSGEWLLSECVGLAEVCRFESVDCQIALSDIYHNIRFEIE